MEHDHDEVLVSSDAQMDVTRLGRNAPAYRTEPAKPTQSTIFPEREVKQPAEVKAKDADADWHLSFAKILRRTLDRLIFIERKMGASHTDLHVVHQLTRELDELIGEVEPDKPEHTSADFDDLGAPAKASPPPSNPNLPPYGRPYGSKPQASNPARL
jgi:hypothetical protein